MWLCDTLAIAHTHTSCICIWIIVCVRLCVTDDDDSDIVFVCTAMISESQCCKLRRTPVRYLTVVPQIASLVPFYSATTGACAHV